MKEFKEVSKFELPEESPGFLLWHVSVSWRSRIENVLKPLGLTHPQFVIMAALGWLTQNGARVNQAAVSKLSGLDPNTVSQIIKGLEKKELISREPSFDARSKNPILTRKGEGVLKKALPAVEEADRRFFKRLNGVELRGMIGHFRKLTLSPARGS